MKKFLLITAFILILLISITNVNALTKTNITPISVGFYELNTIGSQLTSNFDTRNFNAQNFIGYYFIPRDRGYIITGGRIVSPNIFGDWKGLTGSLQFLISSKEYSYISPYLSIKQENSSDYNYYNCNVINSIGLDPDREIIVYSVTCPNVTITDSRIYFDFFWDSYNLRKNEDSINLLISRNISFFPNDTSHIIQNNNDNTNEIINSQNQTTNAINGVNDSINSEETDSDNTSNKLNSFSSMIAEDNVISDLILLPVNLFTKILSSSRASCSSFNLGSLFGTDLVMPCINVSDYLGTTVWSIIDVICSGLLVYSISRKFVKIFDKFTSFEDGDILSD